MSNVNYQSSSKSFRHSPLSLQEETNNKIYLLYVYKFKNKILIFYLLKTSLLIPNKFNDEN